jgi:Rod binding domain-containing protein
MADLPILFSPQPNGQIPNQTTAVKGLSDQEIAKAKEFESLFLSQFVDEMLKTVDLDAATGGRDMHMWRSFMSQAMAESLVEQGGLGLATSVEQMMSAYKTAGSGGKL